MRYRKVQQKYLEECEKTEDFEKQARLRRAAQQKTSLFAQA